MKIWRIVLVFLLAGTGFPVMAQESDRELDNFEKLVREAITAGRTDQAVRVQIRQYIDIYQPDVPEEIQEAVLNRCIDWLAILYAPTYRENFNEKEMRKMIRYYRSPYFQKLLDIHDALSAVAVENANEWAAFILWSIQEEMSRSGLSGAEQYPRVDSHDVPIDHDYEIQLTPSQSKRTYESGKTN